ncbi:hypothetical protein ACFSE2_24945, partial [Ramlibacter ginsenosidimutans]
MSNASPEPGAARDRAEIEALLDRIAKRVKELKTFDAAGIQDRWDSRLEVVQKNVNKLVAEAFGRGSESYRQHAIGPLDAGLDDNLGDRYTTEEFHAEIRKAAAAAAARLQAVAQILTEWRDEPQAVPAAEAAEPAPAPAPAPT